MNNFEFYKSLGYEKNGFLIVYDFYNDEGKVVIRMGKAILIY